MEDFKMESKRITNYCSKENYCILIPVYYECENAPSWRKVFTGTKNECEKAFENYPEYLKATNDENRANRQNKMQEYLFLLSINKKKQAEQIRTQYNF